MGRQDATLDQSLHKRGVRRVEGRRCLVAVGAPHLSVGLVSMGGVETRKEGLVGHRVVGLQEAVAGFRVSRVGARSDLVLVRRRTVVEVNTNVDALVGVRAHWEEGVVRKLPGSTIQLRHPPGIGVVVVGLRERARRLSRHAWSKDRLGLVKDHTLCHGLSPRLKTRDDGWEREEVVPWQIEEDRASGLYHVLLVSATGGAFEGEHRFEPTGREARGREVDQLSTAVDLNTLGLEDRDHRVDRRRVTGRKARGRVHDASERGRVVE
mmetsp:Transcript_48332/g.135451  ORF Transcript_48332/g.135451 Transcript_48332/m.135451 type:complete len:266 (-) Transcript_48332:271-1068(-)